MLKNRNESLPRRAISHLPDAVVPNRYRQPERRMATTAAIAAGAVAVAAAGLMIARRVMGREQSQEPAMVDWQQSDHASSMRPSQDGTAAAMATPGEVEPGATSR